MKIDRRDFIKYSVLGMSAAALLGPAQKGIRAASSYGTTVQAVTRPDRTAG